MAMLSPALASPIEQLEAQARWRTAEIIFWLATLLPFVLTPDYLVLASQVAISALFALSLDLILGYAGIVSLGHAAFFGVGAYTAGLISKWGWGEPLTGLLAAGFVAGLMGFLMSFIIARFRHLALIMITLGFGLLLVELANSASWLTGGADGLQGVHMWPLLGMFAFDLYGYTAYTYALIVLFLFFLMSRRLTNSPFGLALRGIRENAVRMRAIGAESRPHIRKVYTIAGVMAGIRRNSYFDNLVLVSTTLLVSVPVFVLGFVAHAMPASLGDTSAVAAIAVFGLARKFWTMTSWICPNSRDRRARSASDSARSSSVSPIPTRIPVVNGIARRPASVSVRRMCRSDSARR